MKKKDIEGVKGFSWVSLLLGLGAMAFGFAPVWQKWFIGLGAGGLLLVELLNRM